MIKIQKPDRFSSRQNISESILSVTCPLPKKTSRKKQNPRVAVPEEIS